MPNSCDILPASINSIQSSIRKFSSDGSSGNLSLATPSFQNLVQTLKSNEKTCTIVESSCGGLISSSLMSVPGSSRVYFGGTVAYNTKRSGKLLCGDDGLHARLLDISRDGNEIIPENVHIDAALSEEAQKYIQSKIQWTSETALAYCRHIKTDYAIAEGGATGPTFNPKGMKNGFAVLAVAGRRKGSSDEDDVEILAQRVIYSTHANRELNMRLYADSAAELCLDAMSSETIVSGRVEEKMTDSSSITDYTGDSLDSIIFDRSSHLRSDPSTLQDFYQRSDALHIILRGNNEVLFASSTQLALPTLKDVHEDPALRSMWEKTNSKEDKIFEGRTFLGRLGSKQTPLFALFLPDNAGGSNVNEAVGQDKNYGQCYFANTRTRAPLLTPLHNEVALTATAYVNWQHTHQHCCACGSPLEFVQGGTCAKCTNTNGKPHFHWPRHDPSIIVLVTNPSSTHALLARSPRHAPYLYTALAGFVEAGETMESAVAREVHEEAGVTVDVKSIGYIASQSWPFPRSTMIGFHAKTPSGEGVDGLAPINIDPHELVDAKWFEKVRGNFYTIVFIF